MASVKIPKPSGFLMYETIRSIFFHRYFTFTLFAADFAEYTSDFISPST